MWSQDMKKKPAEKAADSEKTQELGPIEEYRVQYRRIRNK
jgi:hypothetical protein